MYLSDVLILLTSKFPASQCVVAKCVSSAVSLVTPTFSQSLFACFTPSVLLTLRLECISYRQHINTVFYSSLTIWMGVFIEFFYPLTFTTTVDMDKPVILKTAFTLFCCLVFNFSELTQINYLYVDGTVYELLNLKIFIFYPYVIIIVWEGECSGITILPQSSVSFCQSCQHLVFGGNTVPCWILFLF
jgi:hypothetical protein